jgi:hypothetical protein
LKPYKFIYIKLQNLKGKNNGEFVPVLTHGAMKVRERGARLYSYLTAVLGGDE